MGKAYEIGKMHKMVENAHYMNAYANYTKKSDDIIHP